jgi:hypothetical protein
VGVDDDLLDFLAKGLALSTVHTYAHVCRLCTCVPSLQTCACGCVCAAWWLVRCVWVWVRVWVWVCSMVACTVWLGVGARVGVQHGGVYGVCGWLTRVACVFCV